MIEEATQSSGNVFADLGFPDASEHQLNAWIVGHISWRMRVERVTQTQAVERMEFKQPDLSAVLHGKFQGCSVERLARCLSALGDEMRLTVNAPDGSEGAFVLEAA